MALRVQKGMKVLKGLKTKSYIYLQKTWKTKTFFRQLNKTEISGKACQKKRKKSERKNS